MEQNDFYRTIKPLVIFCRILGIVPYTFKNNQIQVSKYTVHYTVALSFIFLAMSSEALWMPSITFDSALVFSTEMAQFTAGTMQVLITLINTAAKKQTFKNLIRRFIENDQEFQQLYPSFAQEPIGEKLLRHSVIRLLNLIVTVAITIYAFWQYFTLPYHVITITRFIYPLVLNSMLCYFASFHVFRLKRQFFILNKVLKEQTVVNDKHRHIRSAWEGKYIPLNKICSSHLHVCKAVALWNKAFGYALLASFSITFLSILMTLYHCYLGAERNDWRTTIGAAALCQIYIGELICLCYICDSTTEEVCIFCCLVATFFQKNTHRTNM